jgi:hypothetical protein
VVKTESSIRCRGRSGPGGDPGRRTRQTAALNELIGNAANEGLAMTVHEAVERIAAVAVPPEIAVIALPPSVVHVSQRDGDLA